MTEAALGKPTSFGMYFPDSGAPQTPSDVAVVTPTVLRPQLVTALESVYRQDFTGRVQVLIGVDKVLYPSRAFKEAIQRRPPNVSILVLHLPYSTSVRHGGVHAATDGGSLRTILSFMANSRYVAYLDDDNAWEPDHLSALHSAVQGKVWAYSLRLLVDEKTGEELGVDRWDAVGPGRGRFAAQGGMIDPSCLILDKSLASRPLGRWSEGPGDESDRSLFEAIRDLPHGEVGRATIRYSIRRTNILRKFKREGTEF